MSVRDYINRDKLVYKYFIYNKIGHLIKSCKLKSKFGLKCNTANCSGSGLRASWKCVDCEGNYSIMLLRRDVLSIKKQLKSHWTYNKTSPTHNQCLGELQRRILMCLKQMLSLIFNNL